MPNWLLQNARNADPMLVLALVMLVGIVVADALHRSTRLPRATGLMLVGALASPFALRLVEPSDIDRWKPLLDLAIGALVFELGSRVRPRWLIDNRWLALSCLLEGALAGIAVVVALRYLGVSMSSAIVAGAVAMSTSPVIVMATMHELRPRGQVAERMLLATALNSVLAMLALKAWRVISAVGSPTVSNEWFSAGTAALYVVCGSFLLGIAAGWLLHRLTRGSHLTTMPVLQIALVILATLLATQWKLSPLLALLVAGLTARARMGHRLSVEPNLGTAGAVLTVLLFLSLGLLSTLGGAAKFWPLVLAIIGARLLGKALGVMLTAKLSGLGWKQGLALTLALQPMSGLTVLIAADTFSWDAQLPGVDPHMLHALLMAVSVMQIAGPLMTRLALRELAQESVAAPVPPSPSPSGSPPDAPAADVVPVGAEVHIASRAPLPRMSAE